jgi:hypothetical protein
VITHGNEHRFLSNRVPFQKLQKLGAQRPRSGARAGISPPPGPALFRPRTDCRASLKPTVRRGVRVLSLFIRVRRNWSRSTERLDTEALSANKVVSPQACEIGASVVPRVIVLAIHLSKSCVRNTTVDNTAKCELLLTGLKGVMAAFYQQNNSAPLAPPARLPRLACHVRPTRQNKDERAKMMLYQGIFSTV